MPHFEISALPFADLRSLFHIRKSGGALALTRVPSASILVLNMEGDRVTGPPAPQGADDAVGNRDRALEDDRPVPA
jgi:hypothetical protein